MTIGIGVADVLVAVTWREPALMLYNPLVLMAVVAWSVLRGSREGMVWALIGGIERLGGHGSGTTGAAHPA